MPKISITLEGESWQEIADQMCDYLMRGAKTYESVDEMFADMDQNAARASRIEAKPDKGIVAPDEKFYILSRLRHVLDDYGLGPEEKAEILERVR